MEWQPIETLPQEVVGQWLVYIPGERPELHVMSRWKIANGFMDQIGGHFAFDMGKPIHWAALPKPPAM